MVKFIVLTLIRLKRFRYRVINMPGFWHLRLFFAGLQAQLLHEQDGKRYYVLLMNGRMEVRCNVETKFDKAVGKMKRIDYLKLSEACLFKTALPHGEAIKQKNKALANKRKR